MSEKLLAKIKNKQNKKLTENLASAYSSTNSALLDLFAQAGALRARIGCVPNKFVNALNEDELLATKLAFYTRDIRGGLGERDAAREMFKTLAVYKPEIMKKNIEHIAEYGRFDDLLYLLDTPCEKEVIDIISRQLSEDLENMKHGKAISLLSKWLPSINTSSASARKKAQKLVKAFNMTNKSYRQTLASLRAYSNVVEVRLSNKDYDYLRYDAIPSYAMKRYKNTFANKDKQRFNAYLESLKKGETKINASVLYPYDIVYQYLYGRGNYVDEIAEQQWLALPEYVDGENKMLIMADVSGSMHGRPMATSVGLAIYFAERNKGVFHNKFMTFSAKPELVEVKGETLAEKIKSVESANWDMNTNLEAAFDLVLNAAVSSSLPQEDLPRSIVIISDMEIDQCSRQRTWGFYDEMKQRFEDHGYVIPNIVFWNVEARNDTFHIDENKQGVILVSGQSASVFKTVTKVFDMTPYEYMVMVLSDSRYDKITV